MEDGELCDCTRVTDMSQRGIMKGAHGLGIASISAKVITGGQGWREAESQCWSSMGAPEAIAQRGPLALLMLQAFLPTQVATHNLLSLVRDGRWVEDILTCERRRGWRGQRRSVGQ